MKSKYESLLEAATPLPWKAEISTDRHERSCWQVNADPNIAVADLCGRDKLLPSAKATAQLLTHSANTLPKALEALKSAMRDIENPGDVLPRSRSTLSLATQQFIAEAIREIENPKV